ncbi:hypothetical protein ACFVFJ_44435 [Streptomyces sp. NPDC057717]|uniref:hypothetical protein n=1 Tax=Streptomyces sp. NPDC057717 TaxID=3346224 RepID=UPI0036C4AD88
MADENTSTTDVTDDSGSATDTDQHDDVSAGLGEAGQKALAAERKRAAVAERTAKASQKQLDEMSKRLQAFEDRDKTDAQKLTEAKTAAEQTAADAQARLMRYEVAAAKKLPSEWAARLQGSTQEDLEADADALLQALGTQQQRQTPNYDGGVRTGAPATTDMNALIRQKAGLG